MVQPLTFNESTSGLESIISMQYAVLNHDMLKRTTLSLIWKLFMFTSTSIVSLVCLLFPSDVALFFDIGLID